MMSNCVFNLGGDISVLFVAIITVSFYLRIIHIHWNLFATFHPFYSIFLLTILCSNTLIYIVTLIYSIFQIIDNTSFNLIFIYIMFALEVYSQAMLFCCVFERVFATIFRRKYEYTRIWKIAILSQPFTFVYLISLYFLPIVYQLIARFIVYGITILILSLVLLHNCRVTIKLVGSGETLSGRYQVIENIRALRMILPISIVQVCTLFLGNNFSLIIELLYPQLCYTETIAYLNFARIIIYLFLGLLTPLAVGLTHTAYRRYLIPAKLRKSRRSVHNQCQASLSIASTVGAREKKLPKVVNVLGIEISSVGEQMYFENLSKAWKLGKF